MELPTCSNISPIIIEIKFLIEGIESVIHDIRIVLYEEHRRRTLYLYFCWFFDFNVTFVFEQEDFNTT